ncbi:MAG: alpha/beta hydrolase [Burkholderiales bacterium]|nr:alpha/beta hydrolase [Burkholderiales bacterium]
MNDLSDFDVLMLPGWQNSGPQHWQTHWEAAFPALRRVAQDDWDTPQYRDWSRRLSEAVAQSTRPVILVAHSLGTILVSRWAQESGELARRVAGAFLVAVADVDLYEGTVEHTFYGFAPIPKVGLPFPALVLASHDDDKVTMARAQEIANDWGAGFAVMGHLGHMGSAAQLGIWPAGLVKFGQFVGSLPGVQ